MVNVCRRDEFAHVVKRPLVLRRLAPVTRTYAAGKFVHAHLYGFTLGYPDAREIVDQIENRIEDNEPGCL